MSKSSKKTLYQCFSTMGSMPMTSFLIIYCLVHPLTYDNIFSSIALILMAFYCQAFSFIQHCKSYNCEILFYRPSWMLWLTSTPIPCHILYFTSASVKVVLPRCLHISNCPFISSLNYLTTPSPNSMHHGTIF